MIKTVAQATSTYAMSVFKIPSSLCPEIQSLVARFWWGGSDSSRKINCMHWKLLCRPKTEGGLGFRDVGPFNQALLAKQGWLVLQRPESLVAWILKAKYFPQ